MLKVSYIIKAVSKLIELEGKLSQHTKLSSKMGIMVDADKLYQLPNNKVPVRLNGTNMDVFKHKGLKVYTYRNDEKPNGMIGGMDLYEVGNEIENPAVNPTPVTPIDYMRWLQQWPGPFPICNPGLTNLVQSVEYWRQLIVLGFENPVDYLAIHFYIPSRKLDRVGNKWVNKPWYRKWSDRWEYVKAIAALMEFKAATHKSIIVTECGVCQLTAELPEDVYFMDLILNDVLGTQLMAAMWYNWAELTEYPGRAILAYY